MKSFAKDAEPAVQPARAGAITSKHFTDRQILSEIEGIMSMSYKGV